MPIAVRTRHYNMPKPSDIEYKSRWIRPPPRWLLVRWRSWYKNWLCCYHLVAVSSIFLMIDIMVLEPKRKFLDVKPRMVRKKLNRFALWSSTNYFTIFSFFYPPILIFFDFQLFLPLKPLKLLSLKAYHPF